MFRRCTVTFAAAGVAPAKPAAAVAKPENAKMHTLHQLLIGEHQFRHDAPLKVCNIEHNFGAGWKSEIESYAKTLAGEHKTVLERQIARVWLTRYTTRELGLFGADGGAKTIDAVVRDANVAQGKAFLASEGAEKFEAFVAAEAKNANWSAEDAKKFVDAVKAAK